MFWIVVLIVSVLLFAYLWARIAAAHPMCVTHLDRDEE